MHYLNHLSRLHRIKAYRRDRMRYGFPSAVASRSFRRQPNRQPVERLEPRMLFSGEAFAYAVTDLDEQLGSLGEEAVTRSRFAGDAFDRRALLARRPAVDFDDLADRRVSETGSGTVLFTLGDMSGVGSSGVSLLERELYGSGSTKLSISIEEGGKDALVMRYSLIDAGGSQTQLGSLAFSRTGLSSSSSSPVFAVSWSDDAVRFYVDGQVAATTIAGKPLMDAGRNALSVRPVEHASVRKPEGSAVDELLSYGAALTDDQVEAVSRDLSASGTQALSSRRISAHNGFDSSALTPLGFG
ncbi:MAG: LEPR-XLL domain-containing protein, partial [Phycisphaeraceae bacterium]